VSIDTNKILGGGAGGMLQAVIPITDTKKITGPSDGDASQTTKGFHTKD
jgi:hypothetical protein